MKFALTVLISFIMGTIFGSWFFFHAIHSATQHSIPIEDLAERTVKDVAQAYEQSVLRVQMIGKQEECIKENAKLKQRPFIKGNTYTCKNNGECHQ